MEQKAPLTQHLYRKADLGSIPLSGTFELTAMCNLSCRMCYVRKSPEEVRGSVRPAMTLEQWLSLARQAREAGMLFVLLTGGEPLAWPDFWTLYDELIAMGFLVSINTNGTLIDEAAVEHFKRLPPKRINITLYGAGNETYQVLCGKPVFEKVDCAISALKAADVNIKLNGSFTPHNVEDLEKIGEYAAAREIPLQTTAYMLPPVRRDPDMVGRNDRFTPEQAARCRLKSFSLRSKPEEYISFLENVVQGWAEPPGLEDSCFDPLDGTLRCRAGSAAFWVTWDGWMMPCGLMTEPKVDIQGGDFAHSWAALTQACSRVRLSGLCTNCANRLLCHSCGAIAQAETGSTEGIPRYLCETTRHLRQIAQKELEAYRFRENEDQRRKGT